MTDEFKQPETIEKDKYLRLAADFENYRKNEAGRLDDWKLGAMKDLLIDHLAYIEGLEVAFRNTPPELRKQFEHWYEGIQRVKNRMIKDLKRFGVERIETKGKQFDPNTMEAVHMVPAVDGPSHAVQSEVQAGYTLNGRVIHPAKVVVTE